MQLLRLIQGRLEILCEKSNGNLYLNKNCGTGIYKIVRAPSDTEFWCCPSAKCVHQLRLQPRPLDWHGNVIIPLVTHAFGSSGFSTYRLDYEHNSRKKLFLYTQTSS